MAALIRFAVVATWVFATVAAHDRVSAREHVETVIRIVPALAGNSSQDTIERALDQAARALDRKGAGVVVELGPGLYRLERPLHLGARLSGKPGQPFVIRGSGDARITGSQVLPLSSERSDKSQLLASVPASVRTEVVIYDLPPSVRAMDSALIPRAAAFKTSPTPFEIFDSAGALRPAQWPNGAAATTTDEEDASLSLDPGTVARWHGERDLWAAGQFWSYEVLNIRSADPVTGRLRLYPPSPLGIAKAAPVHIVHAASELDAPGEWYRTPDRKTLLVLPRSSDPIEMSRAESLLVANGVKNAVITNLTFEHSRGDAIVLRESEDLIIRNVSIRWTGGRAVSIRGGRRNGVEHAGIEDTGDGGIDIVGGNRQTLEPGGHFVRRSLIRRFQRLTRSYRGAIDLGGVGNEAVANFISDGQHYAIRFQGNNHTISFNEIERVANDTNDMGAIYTGRDFATRGNTVSHNFIHHIGDPTGQRETKGIYLDDSASGTTLKGNVFVKTQQPVFIGGGLDNVVEGNVFLASEPGVFLDGRGLTWARTALADRSSEIWQRLYSVPFRSAAWERAYPELMTIEHSDPGTPQRNVIRNNVAIGGTDLVVLPEVPLEKQTIIGNTGYGKLEPERSRLAKEVDGIERPDQLARGEFREQIAAAIPAPVLERMSATKANAGWLHAD
ncbi:MAG: right-handed parallel beta-helix repeat-containing protein [Hyphomicrobiaceae bacterium]|nr:right-handed parallel beta-helix repeat-containing protein [Hyphomicrobiaceae bacterium]